MKYAVHFLEPEQECAVMLSMAMMLSTAEHLKTLWPDTESLTEHFDPTDVEVIVVPLHRLGAPAGKSGAEVFVVYMRSVRQEPGALKPSNALIVKLQKRADKLTDEKKAADEWPSDADERFARPIQLYSVRGYTVLVAPFRSGFMEIPDEHRLKFQAVLDLYRLILDSDEPSAAAPGTKEISVKESVDRVLELVAEVHRKSKQATTILRQFRYSEAYEWYLRGTQPDGNARKVVDRLFGADEKVEAFGEIWPNPVKLLDRILKKHNVFKGAAGSVHGDLHPKNIIFDREKQPQVIDFGWARNNMHVVVDYLLLDINLRAMTLASQVPELELLRAARCLCKDDVPQDGIDSRLLNRLEVIRDVIWVRAVRSKAVSLETGDPWLKEYLIPYFLVTFGLLVHLDDAKNQRALLASVLAAAERIHGQLPADT